MFENPAVQMDRAATMTGDAKAAPGIFLASERLAKRVEENRDLTSRLRERLGNVCRPGGPRADDRNRQPQPPDASPFASTLGGLELRLADANTELRAMLEDLDV